MPNFINTMIAASEKEYGKNRQFFICVERGIFFPFDIFNICHSAITLLKMEPTHKWFWAQSLMSVSLNTWFFLSHEFGRRARSLNSITLIHSVSFSFKSPELVRKVSLWNIITLENLWENLWSTSITDWNYHMKISH